ncbi:hypothetical protein D4S03_11510 [bacterium]|nr:MAG: hypothetical protein D4S03_11510 [bacterium]
MFLIVLTPGLTSSASLVEAPASSRQRPGVLPANGPDALSGRNVPVSFRPTVPMLFRERKRAFVPRDLQKK